MTITTTEIPKNIHNRALYLRVASEIREKWKSNHPRIKTLIIQEYRNRGGQYVSDITKQKKQFKRV